MAGKVYENQKSQSQMVAALAPLRSQLARLVDEREILRVVATIPAREDIDVFAGAREEVLKWARKRAGTVLPTEAWRGGDFELLAAGRATMASCVKTGNGILWSLRGDDPDKEVAGRIWSSEISLGKSEQNGSVTLGLRLLVNSSEQQLVIEPAVPGPILQIAEAFGLVDGPVPITPEASLARDVGDIELLVDWLRSSKRRLPIIVATGDEREHDPSRTMLDVDILGKALCGLAHIVSVPADLSFCLSDAIGKNLTVFHGGVRIYEPGFDLDSDPRNHRLILGHNARRSPNETAAELRRGVARESLRRNRLGHEIVSFAAVRSAAIQKQKLLEAESGADDSKKITTLEKQVSILSKQIEDLQGQVDQAMQLSEEESERADIAEKQLHSSSARIEMLVTALSDAGKENIEAPAPTRWEEFTEWCDTTFASQLSLASAARRGIKKAEFNNIEIAVAAIR